MKAILAFFLFLTGCSAVKDYNSHVAARQDGVAVSTDCTDYSGKLYHRVEDR